MTVAEICHKGEMIGRASVSSFAFGVFEILGMLWILIYLRYSQIKAAKGQMESLMLPAYYFIVLYEICVGFIIGLDSTIGFYYDNVYARAVKWIFYQTCSEGVAVLFLHNGVGQRAFRNSFFSGLIWALVSGIVPIIVYRVAGHEAYAATVVVFLAILLLFYLVCWLLPLRYLHRRPALVLFSRFYTIILVIFIIGYSFVVVGSKSSRCIVEGTFAFVDFFLPFVVLRALRQDSQFWQGLYENSSASNLNQPLLGIWDMGHKTVSIVADTICALERKVVPIISFGNLTLDTSKFFSGGSARVYRGRFGGNKVAVKMLFCIELTPERVIDFCNEASLLHSLQHPNVVTCFGVSVMPPAICLVTEFCDVGSLYDFLHAVEPASVGPNSRVQSTSSSQHFRLFLNLSTSTSNNSQSNGLRDSTFTNPLLLACTPADSAALQRSNSQKSTTDPTGATVIEVRPSRSDTVGSEAALGGGTKTFDSNPQMKSSSDSFRMSLTGLDGGVPAAGSSSRSYKVRSGRVDAGAAADIEADGGSGYARTNTSNSTSGGRQAPSRDSGGERSSSFIRDFMATSGRFSMNGRDSLTKRPASAMPNATPEMLSVGSLMTSRAMGFGLGPLEAPSSTSISRASMGSFRTSVALDRNAVRQSSDGTLRSYLAGTSNANRNVATQLAELLPVSLRIRMARDCCAGVNYLHASGFIHCDVKSLNFLVTSDLVVKLADLGEARRVVPDEEHQNPTSLPRNINWSSPEVMRGDANVGTSSDVWSLAFVISEIMTGEVPFDTEEMRSLSMNDFMRRIEDGLRPNLPYFISETPTLHEAITSAWKFEPSERCSAANMLAAVDHNATPVPPEIIEQFHRSIA